MRYVCWQCVVVVPSLLTMVLEHSIRLIGVADVVAIVGWVLVDVVVVGGWMGDGVEVERLIARKESLL